MCDKLIKYFLRFNPVSNIQDENAAKVWGQNVGNFIIYSGKFPGVQNSILTTTEYPKIVWVDMKLT